MINKNEDIVVNHYTNNYNEDSRFENKGKRLEYLTTLEYIYKYAKKRCKDFENYFQSLKAMTLF